MKPDKDTASILRENKEVADTLNTEGWKIIKRELYKYIMDAESIFSVEGKTPEEFMVDLKANKKAIEKIQNWLYNIEGTAMSVNSGEYKEIRESLIINLDQR